MKNLIIVICTTVYTVFITCIVNAWEVPLIVNKDGTYELPIEINGVIKLNFFLDTGASEVNIPADVALTLVRTGTINADDFLPGKEYTLADGSTVKSPRFIIRELNLGGQKTFNVPASIGQLNGPVLLGQSFLSRIASWTIDSENYKFIFNELRSYASPNIESKSTQTATDKKRDRSVESNQKKVEQSNAQPLPGSSQDELSSSDVESIKQSIRRYYELVQNKNIDDAIDCYSSEKRPQIKRSRLETIAKVTEYYKIEKISVISAGESRARTTIFLLQKKYNQQPESWEITMEFIKDRNEWKINSNLGRKTSP